MTPLPHQLRARALRAFSLPELLIATIIMAAVGGAAYFVLNTGLVLYSKNVALNQTHRDGRQAFEKLCGQLHDACGTPDLVDANGATVSGIGPAAGVRLTMRNQSGWYILPSSVLASSSDVPIQVLSGQQAPKRTDLIVVPNLGFQGEVLKVTGLGASTVVTLTTTAGACLPRTISTGNAITAVASPNEVRALVLNRSTHIAVGFNLRSYPAAMSVSVDGINTFNATTSYRVTTNLLPRSVANTPFSFADTTRQFLGVDLRVESTAYRRTNSAEYISASLFRTSIGCRSTGILR